MMIRENCFAFCIPNFYKNDQAKFKINRTSLTRQIDRQKQIIEKLCM